MKQMEHKRKQTCEQTQDTARGPTDSFSDKQVELTRAVIRHEIKSDDIKL